MPVRTCRTKTRCEHCQETINIGDLMTVSMTTTGHVSKHLNCTTPVDTHRKVNRTNKHK